MRALFQNMNMEDNEVEGLFAQAFVSFFGEEGDSTTLTCRLPTEVGRGEAEGAGEITRGAL